jgi:hypothetical protein
MNTLRSTRPFVASLMLIVALAASAPAIAAAPPAPPSLTPPIPPNAMDVHCRTGGHGTICHWTDTFRTPPGGGRYGQVKCHGAPVIVNLEGERRFMTVYDEAGQAVLSRRHLSFNGTLSSPVTSQSVPHIGHATITDDFQENTSTITGLLHYTVLPGQGMIFIDAGIIVITEGEISFVGGPHQSFAHETDALCAALA